MLWNTVFKKCDFQWCNIGDNWTAIPSLSIRFKKFLSPVPSGLGVLETIKLKKWEKFFLKKLNKYESQSRSNNESNWSILSATEWKRKVMALPKICFLLPAEVYGNYYDFHGTWARLVFVTFESSSETFIETFFQNFLWMSEVEN